MRIQRKIGGRKGERGQTLILVALSIVSLLAMAALAIDVVSLYAARSEAQRAADAAALAGAQAFVSSGATTDASDASLQTLAQTMALQYAQAVLQKNLVGGAVPQLSGGNLTFGGTRTNPTVTATIQQPNLTLFFARIWGVRSTSVSATASAEAYNPSENPIAPSGNLSPVAPHCVKPWIIPNSDPQHGGQPFVDPSTGAVTNPGSVIGETINPLLTDCQRSGPGCTLINNPPSAGYWVPLQASPSLSAICPSPACAPSPDNYERSIECCDGNVYSCGPSATATVDLAPGLSANPVTDTYMGGQCLINHNTGAGQDTVDTSLLPSDGPILFKSGSSGTLISTSKSVVTFPIYDGAAIRTTPPQVGQVHIVGFMQAFVQNTRPDGHVQITILNIVGCGSVNTSATPVSGGGTSAIPVRLIQPGS